MKVLALLAVFAAAVLAEHVNYEGYKVYTVTPTSTDHVEFLESLQDSGEFDFWNNAKLLGHPASIMVKPELQASFANVLTLKNMNYSVLIQDVEHIFKAERDAQAGAPKVEKGRISFTEYHRYETIQDYMINLYYENQDKVIFGSFGLSSEGRSIMFMRVGKDYDKPTIVIDAGIHAREWIAPAMAVYIIQQLLENEEYAYLSENVNWLIIPVLNPDGYEYTHTTDRMWRKTRSIGTSCVGVDANRNFGYMFGGLGTSDNECSETYRGPTAFSEPETASYSGFLQTSGLAQDVPLYIALHSYGNWVLFPWGYDYVYAENHDELQEVGDRIADAIAGVNGREYTVGNSAYLLYPAAGASDDWMKSIGASLSYTLELPGGGSQGFDLPASEIQTVVEETWQGILAAYSYVSERYQK